MMSIFWHNSPYENDWTVDFTDRGDYFLINDVLRIIKHVDMEHLLFHLYCEDILGWEIRRSVEIAHANRAILLLNIYSLGEV